MKNIKKITLVIIFLLSFSFIFAGSIDYLSNQSAAYIRTLSRNASTDNADIISYNPAGVTKMSDGFYINFNNQSFIKEYSVTGPVPGDTVSTKFKTTIPSLVIPTFYALYKKDNLGIFASFTIPAGGGNLDYKDGLYVMPYLETGLQQAMHAAQGDPYAEYMFAKLIKGRFEGSSIYYGYSAGAAYAINENISISLTGRYISSQKTYKGSGNFLILNGALGSVADTTFQQLDAEKTASGLGAIIGINLNYGKTNIGFRYETITKLEFETKTKINDWSLLPKMVSYLDGAKERKDLPAMIGTGISYEWTESFKTSIGLQYFFIKQTSNKNIAYKEYDNGYELQTSFEYQINQKLLISMGYNYVVVGGNKKTYNDFEYQLDSHFIGGGCKYGITDLIDLNIGLGKVFYLEEKGDDIYKNAEYNKDIVILSLGLNYKIF